jgi:hypothetical protein
MESLLGYVKELGWHFRIRIKSNFLVYQEGAFSSVDEFPLQPGEALFLNHVCLGRNMVLFTLRWVILLMEKKSGM